METLNVEPRTLSIERSANAFRAGDDPSCWGGLIAWTSLAARVLLLVLTACPRLSQAEPPLPRRPNVVFVLADQWRAQAFGCEGDPNVRTPNLDRFARQNIRFLNAISPMPVCCPYRASLLTGQRPLTHGVFMNDVPLATNAVTLGKVFRDSGYDTAYIGKWHLDAHGRSSFIPPERRQGFEYWKVLECTHDYTNSFYYGDDATKRLWEGYDAIAQTRDAQQYIRAHATGPRPFFLFLAWGLPHDPYQTAPARYRSLYDPKTLKLRPNVPKDKEAAARQMLAGYYAHCTALDDCFGDLLQTLAQAGLEKDTLVVFNSDHGDLLGSHGGRNKQQPYDECVRIPLFVRWPAGLGRSARNVKAVITAEDIMPTLLGLCRIPLPVTVEGLDCSPALRCQEDQPEKAALLSCVSPFGQWTRAMGGRECRGIRDQRYTYVRDLKGPWLLFDNLRDPYQLRNLAGQAQSLKTQERLDGLLREKLRETRDEFLPGATYLKRWGYRVDATGTVPYTP